MSRSAVGAKSRWLARVAAALAGGAGVLTLAAGPVAAQSCYPPGSASCSSTSTTTTQTFTVSDETLSAGQSFRVRVGGFRPGSTVTFTIDGQVVGTGVADAEGFVDASLTLPAGLSPGQHTILASGTGADGRPLIVRRVVTVNALPLAAATGSNQSTGSGAGSGSRSKGSLAKTGILVVPVAAAGLGLVAIGVTLSRSAKKRKAAAA